MSGTWSAVISAAALILAAFLGVVKKWMGMLPERRELRCKRLTSELQGTCPHGELTFPDEGKIGWQSWFRTTFGTFRWWCERCGKVLSDEAQLGSWMQSAKKLIEGGIGRDEAKIWIQDYSKAINRCEMILRRRQKLGCGPLEAEV